MGRQLESFIVQQKTFVILYAEDDENDILFCQHFCKDTRLNLDTRFVRSGDDAMRWLRGDGIYSDRQAYPFPDVLVTDLKMPGANGFDLIGWLRSYSQFNHLPVVVHTGSSLEVDRRKAMELGATAFVTKSERCQSMMNCLRQVLLPNPPQ
jgi:CheY-like chemotaxis protein